MGRIHSWECIWVLYPLTYLYFEFRKGSWFICAPVLFQWNQGKNAIPFSKRHWELVYNTFWLYFHGSWSDMRSLFFRLAACREILCSTKGSTEVVAWKCQRFQIPEMRDAAVLSSVNFSGESPFLLFTHCCFMNHMLLQDSMAVFILPSLQFPPPHLCFVLPLYHVLLSL